MTGPVALFVVEVYTVTAILCGHHGADGRAAARALLYLGRRPRPTQTRRRSRYRPLHQEQRR